MEFGFNVFWVLSACPDRHQRSVSGPLYAGGKTTATPTQIDDERKSRVPWQDEDSIPGTAVQQMGAAAVPAAGQPDRRRRRGSATEPRYRRPRHPDGKPLRRWNGGAACRGDWQTSGSLALSPGVGRRYGWSGDTSLLGRWGTPTNTQYGRGHPGQDGRTTGDCRSTP